VPEWRGHYLNYEQLKRLIYILEKVHIPDKSRAK
jgi:hypothetical protein